MVHHDALADLRLRLADSGADRRDDSAGLVPGDDRLGGGRQAADRLSALWPAVLVQVAAEAFISTTTSPSPGVGSGKFIISSPRSPVKTTPRILPSSTLTCRFRQC
jgi:hypothetical protein